MNENQYNDMNNNYDNYNGNDLNNYNQQYANNSQTFNSYDKVQQEPQQIEQLLSKPIENAEGQNAKKNNSELKTFVIMIIIIFFAVMLYPYIYDFIKSIRFD